MDLELWTFITEPGFDSWSRTKNLQVLQCSQNEAHKNAQTHKTKIKPRLEHMNTISINHIMCILEALIWLPPLSPYVLHIFKSVVVMFPPVQGTPKIITSWENNKMLLFKLFFSSSKFFLYPYTWLLSFPFPQPLFLFILFFKKISENHSLFPCSTAFAPNPPGKPPDWSSFLDS